MTQITESNRLTLEEIEETIKKGLAIENVDENHTVTFNSHTIVNIIAGSLFELQRETEERVRMEMLRSSNN